MGRHIIVGMWSGQDSEYLVRTVSDNGKETGKEQKSTCTKIWNRKDRFHIVFEILIQE